jgi:hypothetical protein
VRRHGNGKLIRLHVFHSIHPRIHVPFSLSHGSPARNRCKCYARMKPRAHMQQLTWDCLPPLRSRLETCTNHHQEAVQCGRSATSAQSCIMLEPRTSSVATSHDHQHSPYSTSVLPSDSCLVYCAPLLRLLDPLDPFRPGSVRELSLGFHF